MRPLIMLQLAAVTLAGEHRRQGSHPRRSGRHRLGKSLGKDLKPPKAAEDERQLAELPDGFLWRITVADGSKMQLYAEEGRITTTAAYRAARATRILATHGAAAASLGCVLRWVSPPQERLCHP